MKPPDMSRPGAWRSLFPKALSLMDHLESKVEGIQWTFGGGTVLMLRIAHRMSKDIDLFVPDPQALGFVNPRLSDAAERSSRARTTTVCRAGHSPIERTSPTVTPRYLMGLCPGFKPLPSLNRITISGPACCMRSYTR